MIEAYQKSGKKLFINATKLIAIEDLGKDEANNDRGCIVFLDEGLEYELEDLAEEVVEQFESLMEVTEGQPV